MHVRADGYRARGWPDDTPEDLLQGYFELLRSTNDLERMVVCATDRGRHHRLRESTGGIGAALAEMTATQQLLLTRYPVDLGLIARVAVHREALLESHPHVPVSIPAMWLRLGDLDHATSLVATINNDQQRCQALHEIALAAVERGDTARAEGIAVDITALAAATQELYWPAQAHLMAAEIHRRCGVDDRMRASAALAEAFAHGITNDPARSQALVAVARFAITIGRPDHAEALSRAIPDPGRSARVLVALADATPPDQTPHLVGEALCTGPWSAYVDLLPHRHPTVVTAIADEVLATATPGDTTTRP